MVIAYFSNDTDFDLSEYEPKLREVMAESLKSGSPFSDIAEVSVMFTDNTAMRGLNNRYRHIDASTDVLSFPMYDSWREWPAGKQQAVGIGDIVISVEQARTQSETYGHSLARELGFLTAHSMLHLMGYDHTDDENEMFKLQDKILMNVGLPR